MNDKARDHRRILSWRASTTVVTLGIMLLPVLAARSARAQTFTTLYNFCSQSGCADGGTPIPGLVQATDGNLYGTTYGGGVNGSGTVFKIAPGGTLTSLYSFCSQSNCTDGGTPIAGLVQAADGNFYGAAASGGASGYGTVFKISPSGTLTTLYSFCSQSGCTDSSSPVGGLVQAADGNLYGTTSGNPTDGGTVFKITPSGTLTTLYSFCSQSECTDGSTPIAGPLVQGRDGNFYGTTNQGGAAGLGTVFKITPSGRLTTLHSFGYLDGAYPYAGLVQATDGNFYGTTSDGGANIVGTVFKVTPSGTLTTIYNFCSQSDCLDGEYPYAALVQDTNGKFYGSTQYGGAVFYAGTVFSLSVGLRPFVETQPAFGKVGAPVKILGNNLTGTTSVTFNGTAAVFHVISSSLITATVPLGATSGKVQVVTPSLTLPSNVPFRVRP